MNRIIILIKIITTIVLITLGMNNLNEPSNIEVALGIGEIILGLAIIYNPVKSLFKKL